MRQKKTLMNNYKKTKQSTYINLVKKEVEGLDQLKRRGDIIITIVHKDAVIFIEEV